MSPQALADVLATGKTRRGEYLWQDIVKDTGAKLHVQMRKDRSPLLVLFENSKHILCARIDRCGATASLPLEPFRIRCCSGPLVTCAVGAQRRFKQPVSLHVSSASVSTWAQGCQACGAPWGRWQTCFGLGCLRTGRVLAFVRVCCKARSSFGTQFALVRTKATMKEASEQCLAMMKDIASKYAKGEIAKADLKPLKKQTMASFAKEARQAASRSSAARGKAPMKRPASARPSALAKRPAVASPGDETPSGDEAKKGEGSEDAMGDDEAKGEAEEGEDEQKGDDDEEEEEDPTCKAKAPIRINGGGDFVG